MRYILFLIQMRNIFNKPGFKIKFDERDDAISEYVWNYLYYTHYGYMGHIKFANMSYIEIINPKCPMANEYKIKITCARSLFRGCHSLRYVGFEMFDFSECTDMSRCFEECYNMDFSNLHLIDTSNVLNMASMFRGCKFKHFNDPKFNTSKVLYFTECFSCCTEAKIIDISSFSLKSCVNDSDMFIYNSNLERIIISDKFRHEAEHCNSSRMFATCDKLKYFGTSNVDCIDMSKFNLSSLSPELFAECSSVRKIIMKSDAECLALGSAFEHCDNLTHLEIYCNGLDEFPNNRRYSQSPFSPSHNIKYMVLDCKTCSTNIISEYYEMNMRYTLINIESCNTSYMRYKGSSSIIHLTNPKLECKFINNILKSLIV